MPESLIVPLPIHKILLLNYDRGRYNMKFLRESKLKSIYDDFFHETISILEKIRLVFSSFNPFVPSLPKQQTTADSFSVVTY